LNVISGTIIGFIVSVYQIDSIYTVQCQL